MTLTAGIYLSISGFGYMLKAIGQTVPAELSWLLAAMMVLISAGILFVDKLRPDVSLNGAGTALVLIFPAFLIPLITWGEYALGPLPITWLTFMVVSGVILFIEALAMVVGERGK